MSKTRGDRLLERDRKAQERNAELKREKKARWHLQRKQACKKKEVIKEKKREAARFRREAIRSDPVLYEVKKKKERERWKSRKQQGKILTRDKMTDRDKRTARKRVRESTKRYRERIKKTKAPQELQHSPANEQTLCDTHYEKAQNISHVREAEMSAGLGPVTVNPQRAEDMKVRGRKKKSANRTKAHREIKKKNKQIKTLNRSLWRTRKKLGAVKAIVPDTPRTAVRKQLKGKRVSPGIRKRLVFGEVLQRQVIESLNIKSVKVKGTAYQIIRGNLLKKYRIQGICGLSSKMLRKHGRKTSTAPLEQNRAPCRKAVSKMKEVQAFFLDDENSIECADTKAWKTKFGKNKIKKRKRYLKGSMKDLYADYINKVQNPLAYTKFCQNKPFFVVPKDLKERDTCLCSKCENMELLLIALNKAKVIAVNSNLSLLRLLCCSPRTEKCYLRNCDNCKQKQIVFQDCDENLEIKFSIWETITEKRKDDKTNEEKEVKRTVKNERLATIKTLKTTLYNELKNFLRHTFREKHQIKTLKAKRENLNSGEIYIWMDFSNNYTCKYDRETQSHYYGASKESVVLHTGVFYSKAEKESFITTSKSSRKDPSAIISQLLPVLKKHLKPGMTSLHLQSDSPSNQYRNKFMFYLVTQYLPQEFPQLTGITYNYTEAGHGKGACDGVGAAGKTALDREVQSGNDVHSFEAVVKVLKEKTTRIFVESIDPSVMKEIDKFLPATLKSFNGTLDMHQFTWNKENRNEVHMNYVSCYICLPGAACIHFKLKNSPWIPNPKPVNQQTVYDESNGPVPKKRKSGGPQLTETYARGDWIAMKYGSHWYPGLVEKTTPAKLTVNFLVKHTRKNDLYLWPQQEDIQSVFKRDVLFKLSQNPQPVDRYHFKIPEFEIINSL